jgi:hypothetical protein
LRRASHGIWSSFLAYCIHIFIFSCPVQTLMPYIAPSRKGQNFRWIERVTLAAELERRRPTPVFSEVVILKGLKLVCFDTDLEAVILKALAWGEKRASGGTTAISRCTVAWNLLIME